MGQAQENEVQVRISAEADTLKPTVERSAQDIEKAAERMRGAVGNVKDVVSGHMAQMTSTVKAANDSMVSGFGALAGSFGMVGVAFAGLAAILAGGAAFKAGVEETQKLTGEANALARALGISASEASVLNIALGDVYSDSETFIAASQKLARELRNNEDGLNKMGLKTRDAGGNLRDMKDLMFDSITVLNGYKEGVDRTMAAQSMFGRDMSDVSKLLKLQAGDMDAAREKAHELGLIVGVENVEANKAYKAAMNDVGDVMSAMRKAIGDAVMPVLTKLGEWFAEVGPAAVKVIKVAIDSLVSAFWILKHAVVVLWETINAMVVSVAEPVRALGEAIYKGLAGDFEGAKAAISNIPTEVADAWKKANEEMDKSAEEIDQKIRERWSKPTEAPGKEDRGGKAFVNPKQKKEKVESRMPEWEAQLAQQKAAYMKSHDMYEMSLEDEKKYWDELLAGLDKGAKEYGSVRKKSADLELQILKKKAQEGRQLAQEEIAEQSKAMVSAIDLQKQAAEQEHALGLISTEELLSLETSFEQERYEIARQGVEQRMALLEKDPNMNPVEYQKLKNQLLEIDRKHALEKRQIENKIQLEQAKPGLSVFKSMETSFAGAITGMITRAQTLRQALGNIFTGIGNAFITEMVAKPLAEFAMGLIRQTALYQAFFGTKMAMEATDAATQMATQKTIGVTSVMSNASIAATAAMASVAAIPLVGWAMAPGVGASTYGLAMGFLPSAEGGWDIPAGATGLMRYHEREMMLPAKHADTIRELGENGGIGRAPVINVTAMDARDVQRSLKKGGALHRALQDLDRRFVSKP